MQRIRSNFQYSNEFQPKIEYKENKNIKAKIENSLENFKFTKLKEKVNDKLFSKMMKNAMSPLQQIKIKSRYDNYV